MSIAHRLIACGLLVALLAAAYTSPAAAELNNALAPSRGATVQTQNGPVLHSPTVYAIYWKQVDKSLLGQTFYYEAPRCYGPGCLSSYGTDANYENRTGTFFQDVNGSPWFGVLNQYWDADGAGQQTPVFDEVTLGGTWEDTSVYPNVGRGVPATRLQPADLQAEIGKAIQQNGWSVTADSLFYIFIPEEVQACASGGLCTNVTINGDACGFHDSAVIDNQRIAYAVLPSPGDTAGCDATLTSPSNDLVVDNAINAEAHELVEAVTDPLNGSGWSDLAADQTNDGGEVGDKCEHDFPGRGSALPDGGNVTLNGHDYILQSLWSDLDGACVLGRTPSGFLGVQGVQALQVEDGSPSIAITGHDFAPSATVLWNGRAIPTTVYSSQAVGVSIPAGSLAKPGAAIVRISQNGATSNPQVIYITQPEARLSDATFAPQFDGTVNLGSKLSVTATNGSGTLGAAQFSGNPSGGDTAGSTNSYFALFAAGGLGGLTVQDCALNGGTQIDWFDPASGWKPASNQTFNMSTGCATLTLDANSMPPISQLVGTAFGSWNAQISPSAPARPVAEPNSGGVASTSTIDDTDPAITYSGGGWGYYRGRPASVNDLGNDVHATTQNGDTAQYTFLGSGISYISERSDGYGTLQIALDGVVQSIVDANAPGVHNQGGQTLFSIGGLPFGKHTLTLTKTGGAFLLVDRFNVQTTTSSAAANTQLVNDTDTRLQYGGTGWALYGNRPSAVFDLHNDVHATMNNGDSVAYSFTGTGIEYISEKSDGYGLVDVYLDGSLQTTVDANAAGIHNAGSQILFSRSGLAAGQHTIKLVKKSGVYMVLDALQVIP